MLLPILLVSINSKYFCSQTELFRVAGGMQRPNLLKHTEYMDQCSRELRDHRQFPSDAIIGHLIALQRLDDQIQDCFFTEDTNHLDINDPRVSMNFRLLQSQLEQWKRERQGDEFKIRECMLSLR